MQQQIIESLETPEFQYEYKHLFENVPEPSNMTDSYFNLQNMTFRIKPKKIVSAPLDPSNMNLTDSPEF